MPAMTSNAWHVAPGSAAASSVSISIAQGLGALPAKVQSADRTSRAASANGVTPGPGLSTVPNGRSDTLRQTKSKPTTASASAPIRWCNSPLLVGGRTLIGAPSPFGRFSLTELYSQNAGRYHCYKADASGLADAMVCASDKKTWENDSNECAQPATILEICDGATDRPAEGRRRAHHEGIKRRAGRSVQYSASQSRAGRALSRHD